MYPTVMKYLKKYWITLNAERPLRMNSSNFGNHWVNISVYPLIYNYTLDWWHSHHSQLYFILVLIGKC